MKVTTGFGTVKILMLKGEKGEPTAPTDEQVLEQLNTWLEAHPEATIDEEIIDAQVVEWLQAHPQYVTNEAHRAYETVAAMQADANLTAGMIVRTLGFHSAGDGGAALYSITDTGTANGMDVIACGSLFAHLVIIGDSVTPEMFGAYGDGVTDDSAAIQSALCTGLPVFFAPKTYIAKDVITKTAPNVIMIGSGAESVIKWGITTTEGLRDLAGMISDDDMENTSYLKSGSVIIENMTFDGNADKITDYPVTNAFGACVFYARENYSVENCIFKNCHADGIQMRGLYGNVKVENCIFKDIGQTQPADGTRNGMTITRGYYDRSTASGTNITNRANVVIENCVFSNIADECVRVDGATVFNMIGCTFENIGQHIVESGHLSDKHDYVARITGCNGKNIGQGIYTTGADGGGVWSYHGLIAIEDCNFDGMCWIGCTAAYKRPAIALITNGYQATDNLDYCPDIIIRDTKIIGETSKDNLEQQLGVHTLFGRNISIFNSMISYIGVNSTGSFITPTKKLNIDNSLIKIPQMQAEQAISLDYSDVDVYVSKSAFVDEGLILGAYFRFIRSRASNQKIFIKNNIFNFSAYIWMLFDNAASLSGAKLYIKDNEFIGKMGGRALHSSQTNPTISALIITGNIIPSDYSTWGGGFNNVTADFYVKENNSNN